MKFWFINGRKSVRQVINICVRCKIHNSKPLETTPASLPEDRIKDALIFDVVREIIRLLRKIYLLEVRCSSRDSDIHSAFT